MAPSKYLLKPGMDGYGHVCPECASPKHRQSRRCAACYYEARRRHEYPNPTPLFGPDNPHWSGGPKPRTGGSKGRPQPQDHPWRKAEKLRLQGG